MNISFAAHRRRKHHRKHHRRSLGSAQRSKFRLAAKACKGKSIGAFRACMKQHLKK